MIWIFIPPASFSRLITPNVETIKNFSPFYISPKESQQFHLNNFFSGYNLIYSLSYNASACQPILEISQTMRLLSESNTSLTSENFIWSFYKDISNFKRKILGLDKKKNQVFTADLELGTNLTNFNLFQDLSSYNASCQHFITLKNHSLMGVLCIDEKNNNELLFMYNLANSSETLGGPFSFENTQNKSNSDVRLVFNENDAFYIIRYWIYPINSSVIEVWVYNLTMKTMTFIENLDKNTFNLETVEIQILDLRVYDGEVFFTEKVNTRIVRFRYHSGGKIDVSNRDSLIPINKIWIYEYGFSTPSLYLSLTCIDYSFILIVNWTDIKNPLLLERYAILPIYQELMYLNFNEDFLMYYAKRNNVTNYFTAYRRGQKLLKNIYLDLQFQGSNNTLFEFIPETNNLIIFSGSKLSNYLLYDPILKINATNVTIADSYDDCNVTLFVNSSYPELPENYTQKNYTLTIKLINSMDTNLYSIVDETKPRSYIDYPGQIQFNLDQYYVGPNISYHLSWLDGSQNVSQTNQAQAPFFLAVDNDDDLADLAPAPLESPLFRINKINQLEYSLKDIQDQIDPSSIIFQNMVSSPLNSSIIFWFVQVSNYTVFVTQCEVDNFGNSPICDIQGNISTLGALIVNLSLAYKENELWFALKLDSNMLDIQFYDMFNLTQLNIELPIGNDEMNQVFDFTIMDFKIVLCFALSKTIWIIDLNSWDTVLFSFNNSFMNEKYGYSFFSPMRVKSQYFHKNILFIVDKVSVFIIDISNVYEGEIIIIKQITSDATKKLGNSLYYLAISQNTLLIISKYPDTIEEYSLSNFNLIYKRKEYPFYNYSIILKPYSFDFNDFDCNWGFLFIQAVDQNQNAVILIYKSAVIAHDVLYSIIPLNTKFPQIFVQTTGVSTMYLTIINNTNILFYEIYRNATLIMNLLEMTVEKFTNNQLNFNITIRNTFQPGGINVSYELDTWDSGVKISLKDPNSTEPKNMIQLKNGGPNRVDFSPTSLFMGSIISYFIHCDDCGKISNTTKLLTPISFSNTAMGKDTYTDIDVLEDGFLVLTTNILLKCDQNFQKTSSFVFSDTNCRKIVFHQKSNITVVACKNDSQNYFLYLIDSNLTSMIINYAIPIDNIASMQVYNDYLIILNAAEDEDQLDKFESIIFVYVFVANNTLNFLDTIDSDDVELNQLIVSGLDIGESDHDDTLRLFILDRYEGLRIVDFNVSNKYQKTQYSLDLLSYVENDGMDDAVQYSAVKIVETHKNPDENFSTFSIIISTVNFHIYEILLQVNKEATDDNFLNVRIKRCYWRYGFYSATNKIFTSEKMNHNRFFVIPYILSNDLIINYKSYSDQIFILFDRFNINFFNRSNVPTNYIQSTQNQSYNYTVLIGGYVLNSSSESYFAKMIETTTNNETIVTMIYNNPISQTIDQLLIRPNISIVFEEPYSNDSELVLTLKNDYNETNVTFLINTEDRTDNGQTKIWIIGLVIALLIVAVILIFVVKKYGKKEEGNEEDMLENEEENEGN